MQSRTGVATYLGTIVALALCLIGFSDAHAARGGNNNASPQIWGTPATSVKVGEIYVYRPTATDANGDPLSFKIRNRPVWANFDASTGQLSGAAAGVHVGTYSDIMISVSDGRGWVSAPVFAITVQPSEARANQPPSIAGSPATAVAAATAYVFQPVASDPDGDMLSFAIQNRPAWASFDASTGRLSGTPAPANVGVYGNIAIGVTDGQTFSDLTPFSLEVTAAPNGDPTISGAPATTVVAGQPYSFTPSASDPDGDSLAFSIQNRPAWATFSTSTGRLSGTPTSTHVGSYANIVISVSDGKSSSALAAFGIEVTAAPNRAPTISGAPATTVVAGQAYSFTPSASDPDGDPLSFIVSGKPAWASFDSATGRLSGTPGTTHVGFYYNIVISVTDGAASASLPAFALKVELPATASVTLSWQAPTLNEDGTPLTDLAGYQVFYGQASGQYSQNLSLPNAGFTSVTIEDLAPATWYFSVKALNAAGAVSGFSNEAQKTIN